MNKRARFATLLVGTAVALLPLAACSSGDSPESSPTDAEAGAESPPADGDGGATDPGEGGEIQGPEFNVGITQFLTHPSLDAATQGFKDVLQEKGVNVNYTYEDAQGDMGTTTTIAGAFAEAGFDLILAVATPSAQAMVNQVTDVPVLFTAVTDPVAAGLVPSWEANDTNVTGTSDLNPEGRPAGLIQEVIPDAQTIGFVYTLGEANSVVQLEALKQEAEELGMTVKEAGVANSSELATVVQTLSDVDVIYVGTDNTVVSSLETVVLFAQDNQIPLAVADSASTERGGAFARGIDYYQLGRRTGEMAYQILVEGASPGSIPALAGTDTEVLVNTSSAKEMGLEFSEEFLAKATDLGAQ
ncbi:MAG: ABC transporter substrate-binding protein [Micrococcales bacterium]|nr:ABC transporter substrate-binding protein [Micrococcales bacterium]